MLDDALSRWENMYGQPEKKQSLSLRFKNVVQRAAEKTGQKVVILVDEYDKPLIQTILDEKLQDNYRHTLKAFYSVLKTQDKYIKFAFLTGVTKFGKVSVFSDLNNLTKERLTSDVLNCVDSVATNPVPMIYQSGYLAIRDYLPRFENSPMIFGKREWA